MGSADLLLILGLFLAGLAVYLFSSLLLSQKNEEQALSWASGDAPAQSKSKLIEISRPLVHNFTLQHARRITNETYRKSVANKINTAGLSGELNVDEFIGLQILWGIAFPIVFIFLNFAMAMGFGVVFPTAIGLSGIYFPHYYCRSQKARRYAAVIADFPFFIDLLALSTKAGLDFIGSIQRIVDKAENSVLADEFRLVLRDIKLGSSRADALRAMSQRLEIGEVTSFISVLIDADATGASISKVLKDQSQQMRMERFVRAEKAGARASQAILIPLMLFIVPAVFIMAFGPVALQFFYGGQL